MGHSGVDRHHRILRNSHSIFHSSWSHTLLLSIHRSTHFVWFFTDSCPAFIDPRNLCGSSWPGIHSYPLTLYLHCSSQNCCFSRMPFGCVARCGGMLMIGCLPASSTISPHRDRVNLQMHFEAVIDRVGRCTWRP